MSSAAKRAESVEGAAQAARVLRRTEILRMGIGSLTGALDGAQVSAGLTAAAEALLEAVLLRALDGDATGVAVIGLGRLGGAEMGFASDADLFVVHDDAPGRAEAATAALKTLRTTLAGGSEPPLEIDIDLRPEGKSGPTVRGIASLAEYYARWSSAWEAQALVRARPVAGDPDLGRSYVDALWPLVWRAGDRPGPDDDVEDAGGQPRRRRGLGPVRLRL